MNSLTSDPSQGRPRSPSVARPVVCILALGAPCRAALGQTAAPAPASKGDYHLFNPTPREHMREMSTDRPDTTESAYTVDAGHLQIEISFVDYTFDRQDDGTKTRTWAVAPINLKVGLLNDTDIQFVLDGYLLESSDGPTASEAVSGFGDFTVRLKQNLWGNDGGDTALALMPYVKFPTGKDEFGTGNIEGGLIIPAAFSLPGDLGLGVMIEFDFLRSADDDRYVVDLVHTVTLAHDLIGDLAGFIEFAGAVNLNGDQDYRALFDAGLTYSLGPDLVLDAGIRIGLTDAAEDFGAFAGMSARF